MREQGLDPDLAVVERWEGLNCLGVCYRHSLLLLRHPQTALWSRRVQDEVRLTLMCPAGKRAARRRAVVVVGTAEETLGGQRR